MCSLMIAKLKGVLPGFQLVGWVRFGSWSLCNCLITFVSFLFWKVKVGSTCRTLPFLGLFLYWEGAEAVVKDLGDSP